MATIISSSVVAVSKKDVLKKAPVKNTPSSSSPKLVSKPIVEMVDYILPKDALFTVKVEFEKGFTSKTANANIFNDEVFTSLDDVEDAIRGVVMDNTITVKNGRGVMGGNTDNKIKDFKILVDGKPSPITVWFTFRHAMNENAYKTKGMRLCVENFKELYPVKIVVPNKVPV